jgi:hypothetical protein
VSSNLQIHRTGSIIHHPGNGFVNAFDEFNEINRKLFGIPEIDELLSFKDRRNICIVNNSLSKTTADFLRSIIVKICTNFHLIKKNDSDSSSSNPTEKKITFIVDAGNGNNLGAIYLSLVRALSLSSNGKIIKEFWKQIVIVRAFTFYQLLNIIINEIPKYTLHMSDDHNKMQIIILDFLGTLFTPSHRINPKGGYNRLTCERDFKNSESLVLEAVDVLLHLSRDHFVIMTYDNGNNIVKDQLKCKFSNCLEIDKLNLRNTIRKAKKYQSNSKDERSDGLCITIKSKKITLPSRFTPTSIYDTGDRSSPLTVEAQITSSNHQELINIGAR